MEQKKLYLLDAYALIFRAYYALIRAPRFTTKGINTSAIFGFVNTLQDLLKHRQPTHIAVCFDPSGPTFRHKAFEQYKAQREATPEDIKKAVPYIKRIVEAYNIPIYEVEGYEADDIIGTLSHAAVGHGFETYMVTGDKDFGQLVNDEVKIIKPGHKGDEFEVLGVEEIKAKYGISDPMQVIDLLALMGDAADNIPGCPGVGVVTAEKLIQQFGSVENLFANTDQLKGAVKTKIEENIDKIKFSKFLATIKTDVPVEFDEKRLLREPVNFLELRSIFNELEFKTLTTRIIDHAEGNIGLENVAAPAAVKPAGQQSLFDFGDTPADTEPVAAPANLSSQEHDYKLITDVDEATAYINDALKQPSVGVHIVSTGIEAMKDRMLGVAVASKPFHAAYIPLDSLGFIIDAVKPLFTGSARIVSNDVKRDIVMLHAAGIEFTAPYYDTGVAHYILQPDRDHGTADIAKEVLEYDAIPVDKVLGPKGRTQRKISEISPDKLVEIACENADLTLQLPGELNARIESNGMTKLLNEIEMPLVEVLASMEIAGARIDVKALNDYSATLTKQMNALEAECFELAGQQFNTASPMQVGEILFDKLKIDDKTKKTKSGQYSTTEEILVKLRDRHPLVGKILDLRGIRKLLSTYVNALPELINRRTGRIHTTYNQTVTATGRLSSTNPNLQNIPVRNEDGKEIRRAFIPADGNLFFSADYSQIELRLVADFSHDETMLDAFAHDEDIHAITAAKIYHENLENVTPEQRRKAKTANFGILYGISAFGLSERLTIPRSEAKMLIDGYFTTFPQVKQYIERSIAQAKEKGYVTTLYGRRRMLPDINSRNAVVRGFSERNAVNAPIQGTAADIIKIAMVHIFKRFKDEGLKSKMILQVHDELNFDTVPSEIDRVKSIVVDEMENAYHGGVKLTASCGTAHNWLDAH